MTPLDTQGPLVTKQESQIANKEPSWAAVPYSACPFPWLCHEAEGNQPLGNLGVQSGWGTGSHLCGSGKAGPVEGQHLKDSQGCHQLYWLEHRAVDSTVIFPSYILLNTGIGCHLISEALWPSLPSPTFWGLIALSLNLFTVPARCAPYMTTSTCSTIRIKLWKTGPFHPVCTLPKVPRTMGI